MEAFEANERLMGWQIGGLTLLLLSLLAGALWWRTWGGKAAVALVLLPAVWLLSH